MTSEVFGPLSDAGLNLVAVFDLPSLPLEVREGLLADAPSAGWSQLILIGNGGPTFWRSMQAAAVPGADPMDDFSRTTVERWCATTLAGVRHHFLYPGPMRVGLQQLGIIAGWHHPSPFMVGIQPDWGSWFGYRVALLAETALPVTPPRNMASPCLSCQTHACIRACSAGALQSSGFVLDTCLNWRIQPQSTCAETCLARLACPVGQEHRYPDAQIRHSYGHSLAMIRHYRATRSVDATEVTDGNSP